MSESAANSTMSTHLTGLGFTMYRMENRVGPGCPDFHYLSPQRFGHATGWIESKYVDHLPARTSTPISILFQEGQPSWLRNYTRAGGRAWIIARLGTGLHPWMLFWGGDVDSFATVKGHRTNPKATYAELEKLNAWSMPWDWNLVAQRIAMDRWPPLKPLTPLF